MRLFLCIATLLISTWLSAQPYGNEWIDYSQTYFKIKVPTDGIYRLSFDDLSAAGIPVASISPGQFALYAREEEQALYVSGAGDGSFDMGDYIEFYGRGNDGWLDSLLYPDPNWMGNPYFSLVNDTIHYFLTWNDAGDHLRYEEENGTDFGNYLSPDYLRHTVRSVFFNQYNFGILLAGGNNVPDYVEGEGWMSSRFGLGGNLEYPVLLSTSNKADGTAPAAVGRTVFASASNSGSNSTQPNHHIRVYRGENDAVQLGDISFNGYERHAVNFNVAHGQVADITRINHKVIDDLDVATDYFRVSHTEITYSHSKDISDFEVGTHFVVPPNPSQDYHHMDLEGGSFQSPIVYSIGGEGYRITGLATTETFDFLLPNQTNGSSRIFIGEESEVITPSIEAVGVNGQFTDYSLLSPDSAFIIITHDELMSSASIYANYRDNSSRDALVVNVNELYDQFGGGIEKHFFGIRRFTDLALDVWPSAPGHLFLMGKSIFFEPQDGSIGARNNPVLFNQIGIPSFGSPGSDVLFTSGLNGVGVRPAIATGRLSAINNTEVLDYLDKVVTNETSDPAAWMKNVIHFGGGNSIGEQAEFSGYLSNYEAIIEDTCFGGNVSTFLKTSSLPIELNLSDSISDIIADGVSIITFFGHAGGGQFDQSIDEPQNLEWGAHPLMIINSCFSGDIHKPGRNSASELYTILADKGSIGFIASVQQGFSGRLNQYSDQLYRQLARENYGASIGQLMQETIDHLAGASTLEGEARASVLMNLLQGDPAMRIFSPDRPDLMIDASSISIFPEIVTALTDSITVQVSVSNIGKATNTPFGIELIRTYPDGTESVFEEILSRLYFRDTVTFRIPTDFANGFGINTFRVSVDLPNNVIDEIDNFINNRVNVSLPITDGGVFPVVPYEFAIIPESQVTLKASTGNPFAPLRDYRLQIDTTDLYNSPLWLEHSISQTGGILSWEVPQTLSDSTVYYWRVAEVPTDGEDWGWRESSFQYINERVGWGQSHYFQFKNDRFNNVIYDRPERDFDFFSGIKNLKAKVIGNSTSSNPATEYYIDFQVQDYAGCTGNFAYHVAVVDPVTLEAWETRFNGQNPDHYFGNANDNGSCRNRTEKYFIFWQNNAAQMDSLRNMIENEVPDGHYLMIYTFRAHNNGFANTYFPGFQDFFTDLGAEEIAAIDTVLPFIYIGVKGEPNTSVELVGETLTSIIELDYDMQATGNSGSIFSPLIGPATSWDHLYWQGDDVNQGDSARIEILGYTPDGSELLLDVGSIDLAVADGLALDGLISAEQYPHLRLRASLHDPLELDPVQIDRWQIIYGPVPEAALDPQLGFSFHNDTIQEGEQIQLISSVANISDLPMDSMLVHYWIETASNERIDIAALRKAPLPVGGFVTDTLVIPSIGLSGAITLWVEANPIVPTTGEFDQPEQYHFNNIGQLRFQVQSDRENPILDVTFDGHHILDGDLVSTAPEILIRLDDENPFLLMNDPADTSFFTVFLTDPMGNQRRIYFNAGDGGMLFIPASGVDNVADILYNPELAMDGEYQMLVTAADKSGNASGDVNYQISFTVDSRQSVTEVLNYPNPFSTSTRFVFTLTGRDVPDEFKIQIMTITGKVVKEIHKEELGDLHIGRNISNYAWDGTDTYGDRLANGVYIYRVIVKDAGDDLDVRATDASGFFKKGYGKMYLMR